MPKAEIHVHLEGATRAETSFAMAQRNGVALPVSSLEEWRNYFAISRFPALHRRVSRDRRRDPHGQRSRDPHRSSSTYDQARQNVRYTECFISMSLHLRRFGVEEILDALARGIARG